ncbi:hypothetical protein TOK_3755 [Pseudonocardia sp. N23]|nr:hypothetical protein TOK_3755 [Pseudonocardia sp. N23]
MQPQDRVSHLRPPLVACRTAPDGRPGAARLLAERVAVGRARPFSTAGPVTRQGRGRCRPSTNGAPSTRSGGPRMRR